MQNEMNTTPLTLGMCSEKYMRRHGNMSRANICSSLGFTQRSCVSWPRALRLPTPHLQMAEGSQSVVLSLCISLWWVISAGKSVSKKDRDLGAKNKHLSLKTFTSSQRLAIRLRVHTSDGGAGCAASLCSFPTVETSDLDAFLLPRKLFQLFFWQKAPCNSDSLCPLITRLNLDLLEWLFACNPLDHHFSKKFSWGAGPHLSYLLLLWGMGASSRNKRLLRSECETRVNWVLS